MPGSSILCSWKLWLGLAAVAFTAAAAFNWSWLVAAGAAPLLSLAPCLAICALHLCARKGTGGGGTVQDQHASGHAP
jgi:hypothetical protein